MLLYFRQGTIINSFDIQIIPLYVDTDTLTHRKPTSPPATDFEHKY